MRNAIAHQGGFVVPENEKKLQAYGYKLDHLIDISDSELKAAVKLARESCSQLRTEYSKVLPV